MHNSQRFNQQNKHHQNNDEIEQYFGNGNIFEQQKLSGGSKVVAKPINKPKKEPFSMLSQIDQVPIEKGRGFLAFFILMVIMLVWLLFYMSWGSLFNTILLGIIAFLGWKRLSFQMPDEFHYYLSNANVTWKAFLHQIPLTNALMDYSRHILLWSILAISVESILLDLFLPSSMTSLIHSISFFGILIGLTLCFGNRQYAFMNQALTLYGWMLMLQILVYGIAYAYMPVLAGFTFLFAWVLASYLKEWALIQKQTESVKKEENNDISHID
jgi:hypothetical protein